MKLDPAGLEKALTGYRTAVRDDQGPTAVVTAVLTAYLGAAAVPSVNGSKGLPRRLDGRVSPFPRACAAMAVGDKILAPPMILQCVRQRFPTARALMDNPDAQWRCSTRPDGRIMVERLPDGAKPSKDPKLNPKAVEMASLERGQSILSQTIRVVKGKGMMATDTKVQARRILNNFDADWKTRSTSKGVRLTRTK